MDGYARALFFLKYKSALMCNTRFVCFGGGQEANIYIYIYISEVTVGYMTLDTTPRTVLQSLVTPKQALPKMAVLEPCRREYFVFSENVPHDDFVHPLRCGVLEL